MERLKRKTYLQKKNKNIQNQINLKEKNQKGNYSQDTP